MIPETVRSKSNSSHATKPGYDSLSLSLSKCATTEVGRIIDSPFSILNLLQCLTSQTMLDKGGCCLPAFETQPFCTPRVPQAKPKPRNCSFFYTYKRIILNRNSFLQRGAIQRNSCEIFRLFCWILLLKNARLYLAFRTGSRYCSD